MKELVKQYLDQAISRRRFVAGLTAIGLSSLAARSMAQSLAPADDRRPDVLSSPGHGTGELD
jgi:hypothetical protein